WVPLYGPANPAAMNALMSSWPVLYTPGSIIEPSEMNRSAKASASCAAHAATIRAGTAAMAACSACIASAFGEADLLAVILVSLSVCSTCAKGSRARDRAPEATVAPGPVRLHLLNCGPRRGAAITGQTQSRPATNIQFLPLRAGRYVLTHKPPSRDE